MAETNIVLIRSVRNRVEKLEFNREDGTWRVVLTRPDVGQKLHPAEVVKKYGDTIEAWNAVTEYVRQGFKIVYFVE